MEDLRCPKCGKNFLRTHSIICGKDVRYEWECSLCNHYEGNYETKKEAREDYEKKYGGKNNV